MLVKTQNKKILFIGDIVANPGRRVLEKNLRRLQDEYCIDFTVANGENSSGGFGMSKSAFDELCAIGIDAFTMGNHTWDKKELATFIDKETNIVRPLNFSDCQHGVGFRVFQLGEQRLALINMIGQIFMQPADCPFAAADKLLAELSLQMEQQGETINYIIVDMHAEATSEKMAMGWYLDGRVSAVLGTHTHVQTNDARLLPKGTAYITDVGMTGPHDSILGMDPDLVLRRFLAKRSSKLQPAAGDLQINAVVLELLTNGRAANIKTINLIDPA